MAIAPTTLARAWVLTLRLVSLTNGLVALRKGLVKPTKRRGLDHQLIAGVERSIRVWKHPIEQTFARWLVKLTNRWLSFSDR